ncbi:hypothetical protein [Sphingomonas hengshuiensis]|uniref:Lipoprotein n=1 Tax=Sphingomonas hengshuiensis TaxID=1609977 RepID=A0A7U4J8G8_9SPHN|nr:hypothetical protein [Sphingomonas hengshuiensis]AJP72176.1 hypothetical protein TS85_10835 [Sphingomonas hengshuiensis]
MRKRLLLIAVAGLAVAACQPAADEKGSTPNVTVEPGNSDDLEANAIGNDAETGNVLATVLGMSDRQRNVVFIRAILDAGLPCQEVKASTRLPDQDGQPLWRADCDGGKSHMISITPDGTANIISRSDDR